MKGRVLFVAGIAVGYVLGARAGRKRYDQIAGAANKIWQTPGIQKQVGAAQDFAAARIGDIPGAVFAGVKKTATVAVKRAAAGRKAPAYTPPTGTATNPADAPAGASGTASSASDDQE